MKKNPRCEGGDAVWPVSARARGDIKRRRAFPLSSFSTYALCPHPHILRPNCHSYQPLFSESMDAHTSTSFTPRAPQPAYPYQQPPSYDLMLATQSTSTFSLATPPLVTRSIASTPSSSTLPEVESMRGFPADESEILYATGLDHLDLNGEESTRWNARLQQDEMVPKASSLRTKPSSTSFVPNPHASPYIPTIVRRRATADPVNCGIEGHTWQQHREWLRPFRAGSVTSYAGVRQGYAQDVVAAGPWDTAIMSELTARFVERVAEGCSDTLAYVAPLASEIHRYFQQELGDGIATSFIELLKQHLLSEFRAWWLSVSILLFFPLACSEVAPHRTCPPPSLMFLRVLLPRRMLLRSGRCPPR